MYIPKWILIVISFIVLIGVAMVVVEKYDLKIQQSIPRSVNKDFEKISSSGDVRQTYLLNKCESENGIVYIISNVNLSSTSHYYDENGKKFSSVTFGDFISYGQDYPKAPIKTYNCEVLKEIIR